MDYSSEPSHSPLLIVQDSQPFNAEPSAASLVEFPLTPEDLVYCRNHGPVPNFDSESYSIVIKGGSKGDITLSLNDLRSQFPISRVVAVLQASCWQNTLVRT